ncbi:hypothetical protein [Terrabacter terrigena]|uniref:Uncharacterized protein n=1 Tax=Terrabacter terrigena TaxID=574718 RepID=A0ABW3MYQ0_9MICO
MSGGEVAVVVLSPFLLILGITAYAMACTRYPRRDRTGGKR